MVVSQIRLLWKMLSVVQGRHDREIPKIGIAARIVASVCPFPGSSTSTYDILTSKLGNDDGLPEL